MTKKPSTQTVPKLWSNGHWVEQNKDKTLTALEPYFRKGLSIYQACNAFNQNNKDFKDENGNSIRFVNTTIQYWYDRDENVKQLIDYWRYSICETARKVVYDTIEAGDDTNAKWLLERLEREQFSTRTEQKLESETDMRISIKDVNNLPISNLSDIISELNT